MGADAGAVCPTAFWTAHCRALDGDAASEALCGQEGAAIGAALEAKLGVRAAVGVRTKIFDARIERAIRDEGVETIVSLGCGLDARALRWPGARWIEVDRPAVIAWKRARFAAMGVERAPTFVSACLSDVRAIDEVMAQARGATLVVLEGVLQYLAPDDALRMLATIARRGAPTTLLADVGGGAWSRLFAPIASVTRSIGAPYRNFVSDVDRFFRRGGWRVIDRQSISRAFSRPISAYFVPGWSSAARVVEAVPVASSGATPR